MFTTSATRIGLASKIVKRKLNKLTKLALPAVLLLDKNRSCVLLDYDLEENLAKVIMPGLSSGEVVLSLEKLNSEYTGELIIIKQS